MKCQSFAEDNLGLGRSGDCDRILQVSELFHGNTLAICRKLHRSVTRVITQLYIDEFFPVGPQSLTLLDHRGVERGGHQDHSDEQPRSAMISKIFITATLAYYLPISYGLGITPQPQKRTDVNILEKHLPPGVNAALTSQSFELLPYVAFGDSYSSGCVFSPLYPIPRILMFSPGLRITTTEVQT